MDDVPDWELMFLVSSYLDKGPCSQAADMLRQEMATHGLLPTRRHMGHSTAMSVGDVAAQVSRGTRGDPSGHLQALLGGLLSAGGSAQPPAYMTSGVKPSLLGAGSHTLLPGRESRSLRPPTCKAVSVLQFLAGRQLGRRRARLKAESTIQEQYGRLYTLLAHFKDIFMATFDKTGRRLITGSVRTLPAVGQLAVSKTRMILNRAFWMMAQDDKLVKIWAVHTGELLFSLRGHQGDIVMIDVNPGNTLVASADTCGWVRLWRLRDGHPLMALKAHPNATTIPVGDADPSSVSLACLCAAAGSTKRNVGLDHTRLRALHYIAGAGGQAHCVCCSGPV